jgi:hypothetical protein
MHVGLSLTFQKCDRAQSDREVWDEWSPTRETPAGMTLFAGEAMPTLGAEPAASQRAATAVGRTP